MPAPRESLACRYLLSCLLLLMSAGALAEVRDVRMHGPSGDAGTDCVEPDTTEPSSTATPAAKPVVSTAKPSATHVKPAVTVRGGGDDASTHAPRWHSFVPGMFR